MYTSSSGSGQISLNLRDGYNVFINFFFLLGKHQNVNLFSWVQVKEVIT